MRYHAVKAVRGKSWGRNYSFIISPVPEYISDDTKSLIFGKYFISAELSPAIISLNKALPAGFRRIKSTVPAFSQSIWSPFINVLGLNLSLLIKPIVTSQSVVAIVQITWFFSNFSCTTRSLFIIPKKFGNACIFRRTVPFTPFSVSPSFWKSKSFGVNSPSMHF